MNCLRDKRSALFGITNSRTEFFLIKSHKQVKERLFDRRILGQCMNDILILCSSFIDIPVSGSLFNFYLVKEKKKKKKGI